MTMNNPLVKLSGVDDLDNIEWGTARTETSIWPVLEAERPYICEQPFYTSGIRPVAATFCTEPQNFNVTYRDSVNESTVATIDQLYSNIAPGFSFQYLVPPPYNLTNILLSNVPSFAAPTRGRSRIGDDDYLVGIEKNPGPVFTTSYGGADLDVENSFVVMPRIEIVVQDPIVSILVACTLSESPSGGGSGIFEVKNATTGSLYNGIWEDTFDANGKKFLRFALYETVIGSADRLYHDWQLVFPTFYPGFNGLSGVFSLQLEIASGAPSIPTNVNIVGFSSPNPLWMSNNKPPSTGGGTADVIIVGSELDSPLWVSRAKPDGSG